MLKTVQTALCPSLENAVLYMADRLVGDFAVSAEAPSTYRELCTLLDSGAKLVVYDGGSENTMFSTPSINYAFRAWHDWCHWTTGYDFSLVGEMFTCNTQIEQLWGHFSPADVTAWIPYLTAEVIGQRLYYEKYGEYITDQRAFVLAYINDPVTALNRMW